jgi:serine phosphatase RsbU (regulator of sigma subunit)/pSer/pThr/pTyr-binding forkhead associated (FHA) protein
MPDAPAIDEAVLEIHAPDNSHRSVRITEFPFLIGRGAGSGNHLQFSDSHISRSAAAILFDGGYYLEDRGQRGGVFLNGEKIAKHPLRDGDVITFSLEAGYKITFHTQAADASVQQLLTQIESITRHESSAGNLGKINLLLQATMLLHSQLPLDDVLATMVDHAIAVTEADRGLLLEADAAGSLLSRITRGRNGLPIPTESFTPSQTAQRMAIERRSSVITADLREFETDLQAAESIAAQELRAVVVIPLYAMPRAASAAPADRAKGHFLGLLYLDSRRPAAFSLLDRQILDAIAAEAASILHNARLVERERERQRLEQELSIAREIQQALLPPGFRDFPHLAISGASSPCLGVGGDYFDVFPISDKRTAFLIADVSGKGLGAALLTTMLQGALSGMKMGADPASVFSNINRFLCEHSEVGRYATMFFGILDCEGRFEFINAGHPLPLLLRAGEVSEPFSEGCLPVGLLAEAQYAVSSATLQTGDVLVMFSDGVTEAENAAEDMFGTARLREVLIGQHATPLENLQKTILDSVQTFSGGAKQADDITLLIARYREPAGDQHE